ncbi:GerMN domain-containing protein [Deinococcus sp.]|uniref:GerMN domain-containing protein n=1 Tax=Deinococcus sp. TaxID=47478 RepID=UPI003B5C7FC7
MSRVLTPINILGLLLLALAIGLRSWVANPPPPPSPPALQLEAVQPLDVTLSFPNTQADGFVTETRTLQVEGKSPGKVAQAAAAAWARGPLSGRGLRAVPQNSDAPEVWVRGPHYVVSLPRSYAQLNLGVSGERMVICSLARTLLAASGQDVLFTFGGAATPTLLGHLDLRRPFTQADCAE